MMMFLNVVLFAFGALALQALPPLPALSGGDVGFDLNKAPRTIFVTSDLAAARDQSGLTLIPPSGEQFATTFAEDLSEVTQDPWTVQVVDTAPNGPGIVLAQYRGNDSNVTYENGTPTDEAYELVVQDDRIVISGRGSRGAWWGTRTVLQYLYQSNFTTIPAMSVVDAPAYATRGYMLDAGRKWYTPSFLKELCTFASFFKMSEFHYHVSDNYPLNRGHNETWQDVYSQFSLRPEDPELLEGLIERVNETLSREDYADLESHCASRGIAVVPEIEAPGHCLTITKWKPELALEKKDLLNLSHPDSIPTVQRIWDELLPWFNVKEVHIGADEYNSSLADVYIDFVNTMATHILETSNKSVRAWGTPFDQPTEDIRIDPTVILQHWQHGQSDPVQIVADGHQIINSEDTWAYISIKNDHAPILPARYPQFFNNTRILNYAGVPNWQWSPDLFNPFNTSEEYQLPRTSAANKGAIMASWNDNGPDASTQLEAYYGWRLGLPLVAARAWSGARGTLLDPETIDDSIRFLAARAPAQNLDRKLSPSQLASDAPANETAADAAPLFSWDGDSSASVVRLGHGSKGLNHTLRLRANGPFALWSADVTLNLTTEGRLVYTSNGWPYPLRSVAEGDGFDPGHPGRIWVNGSASSHEEVVLPVSRGEVEIVITTTATEGSRVSVDGKFMGRFEVFVFGGRNTLFSWSQMAFVAPLEWTEGRLLSLGIWDGVVNVRTHDTAQGNGEVGEYTQANGTVASKNQIIPAALVGLLVGLVGWWIAST
jgi:hexosaminidase